MSPSSLPLPFALSRTVAIAASPELVFRYVTENERFASWFGTGSTIDARSGGAVRIRFPGGIEVMGDVVDVRPPDRIVYTYGFASGSPIPPGTSEVGVRLEALDGGTRLHLTHTFAQESVRDEHVQGWRYQLAVLANLAADEEHREATATVDAWFRAWSEPDATTRDATLDRIATAGIRFRDRFSLVEGLADLRPHLAAVHRFMPGMRIERSGEIRHCQGTVLADWISRSTDGAERGRGTNVFVLAAGARIDSVVGLFDSTAAGPS
jgi:uncharacterized protein YndB with AHSA1/START domain